MKQFKNTHITYITHTKKKRNVFIISFLYIKMTNNYYEKNKEKLRKKAPERYQSLSEEEKDKRQKKDQERYQNWPKEEKA